jgi:hypothetical protein
VANSGFQLRRLWPAALLILTLVPSAWLAWHWRAMPHLGFYHDDSIFWVSAKGLASGDGYRILSLPNQPYQTKYPPLYPALLSLVWRLNPNFPDNLPLAMFLAWLPLPLYLWLVREFLKQYKFSVVEQAVLCAIAALNPVAVLFSISLMPELWFTALLLASVLMAERATDENAPWWLAALAGLAGGLAYLTRSAALPLLGTAPLCFVWKKQYRNALAFGAAMLPAVAGWQLWVRGHVSNSWDLVTLYYTNYFGFQAYNVPLRDLPLVMWHNLDGLLMGIGKALTFDFEYGSKHLERLVAAAAIAGSIRLARRTGKLHFPMAAAGFTLLLLVWHYPPDQRFVYPIYPLLLAGLWAEIDNVLKTLRLAWRKRAVADRAVAAVAGAVLAGFAGFLVYTTISGDFAFIPAMLQSHQADLQSKLPVYAWIKTNAPRESNVFAYDDPVVFLYTGRRSCGMPIPTKLYYHDDDAGIEKLLHSIPDFARENRLDYLLLARSDFYRDLQAHGAEHLAKAVETNNVFERMYQAPGGSVYHLAR